MKKVNGLKILLAVLALGSCSKESPELMPCMCDGSESTLGLFDCMCEPMKKKPVRRITYIQDEKPTLQTVYIDEEQRNAYLYLHQRRDSFAPIKLDHVDFRIKKGRKYDEFDTKLGNYRFRIFGCRRESKNVFLNQGRAMQKDMRFFDVFFEQMNDYFPVVVEKNNPYYLESDRIETPEYLVTAEITDYFMNICDEFDWDNVKQRKLRSGTSEIAVVWRITNLLGDEVYCKGMTTGYGQVSEGEPNGETLLVERAFEDALGKLPEIQCFNQTVSQRIRPEDLQRQKDILREREMRSESFKAQYDRELKGVELLQECASGLGKPAGAVTEDFVEQTEIPLETRGGKVDKVVYLEDGTAIDETSGVRGSGSVIDGRSGILGSGLRVAPSGQVIDKDGKVIENITVDSEGRVYGADGKVIEGVYVDADGNIIDSRSGVSGTSLRVTTDGKIVDEAGNIVEGMRVDADGKVYDSDGRIVEGAFVDASGRIINSEGQIVDTLYVDANGEIVHSCGGDCVTEVVTVTTGGRWIKGRNSRTGGLTIDERCRAIEIGGDGCTVVKNVKENVTIADDYWIDVPLDTDEITLTRARQMAEDAFAEGSSSFCIRNQSPYDNLNPQNLYKVRASVVSVENQKGKKGAGLIIADNMILTSADLMVKNNNTFDITTINGKKMKASAFRANPSKNVALLLLDRKTSYTPLPLSLELPEVNKDVLMTLGLLDLETEGEGYIDNEGKVIGYRWTEERGPEIIVDTFVQSVSLGGALIDKNGNIVGIAHESKKLEDSPDLFIPIDTALKALGLEICGRAAPAKKPAAIKTYETPLADAVDNSKDDKAPKPMKGLEKK